MPDNCNDGVPGWKEIICNIMVGIGVGLGIVRTYVLKQTQTTDPGGAFNTLTGSDKTGTKVQIASKDSSMQLVDSNGNPVDDTGNDSNDDSSQPPSPDARGGSPERRGVARSQTPTLNPGTIRGKSGSAGYHNHYQIDMENQRMAAYDRQQDIYSSAPAFVIPAPERAALQAPDTQPSDIPWYEQMWNGVKDFFNGPKTQPDCGYAAAGCIDPSNPFKGKGGDDSGTDPDLPDVPLEPNVGGSHLT